MFLFVLWPAEQFHTALLEASGNDFLMSLTLSVKAAISWSTIFKQRHEPLKRDPMPDHRKVYLAIEKSDPVAARKAMTQLVGLALIDITTAPKWPTLLTGSKPSVSGGDKPQRSRSCRSFA